MFFARHGPAGESTARPLIHADGLATGGSQALVKRRQVPVISYAALRLFWRSRLCSQLCSTLVVPTNAPRGIVVASALRRSRPFPVEEVATPRPRTKFTTKRRALCASWTRVRRFALRSHRGLALRLGPLVSGQQRQISLSRLGAAQAFRLNACLYGPNRVVVPSVRQRSGPPSRACRRTVGGLFGLGELCEHATTSADGRRAT